MFEQAKNLILLNKDLIIVWPELKVKFWAFIHRRKLRRNEHEQAVLS